MRISPKISLRRNANMSASIQRPEGRVSDRRFLRYGRLSKAGVITIIGVTDSPINAPWDVLMANLDDRPMIMLPTQGEGGFDRYVIANPDLTVKLSAGFVDVPAMPFTFIEGLPRPGSQEPKLGSLGNRLGDFICPGGFTRDVNPFSDSFGDCIPDGSPPELPPPPPGGDGSNYTEEMWAWAQTSCLNEGGTWIPVGNGSQMGGAGYCKQAGALETLMKSQCIEAGNYWDDATSTCGPFEVTCPPDAYGNIPVYDKNAGGCKTCPPGQVWSTFTKSCGDSGAPCPNGAVKDPGTGICYDKASCTGVGNTILWAQNGSPYCGCAPGYEYANDDPNDTTCVKSTGPVTPPVNPPVTPPKPPVDPTPPPNKEKDEKKFPWLAVAAVVGAVAIGAAVAVATSDNKKKPKVDKNGYPT